MLTLLKQLICQHKGLEGKHIYHEENGVKYSVCSWCDKYWEEGKPDKPWNEYWLWALHRKLSNVDTKISDTVADKLIHRIDK